MIVAMKQSVLLFAKRNDSAAQEASKKLAQWLKSHSYGVVDVTGSEEKISAQSVKEVQLGVVFGGDGTFLTLVRRLEKKDLFPLMGINLGTLGFITEFGEEEMLEVIQDVLDKKYEEQLRPLLQVDLWRKDKCIQSGMIFNDAVINKDASTSMLKLTISAGKNFLSHVRADGYIISTPTGSTGYALSAGGPLLHPEVNALLLIPICSHSLSMRPIVLPQNVSVEVTAREFQGAAYLVYDGQINIEIKPGDQVRTQTSETSLRLIRSPKLKWSETLRAKLQMN